MLATDTTKPRSNRIYVALFILCGLGIMLYVVFTPPLTGLTDQNDFWRLQYGMANVDHADFHQSVKYRYVATEYRFTPFPHKKLLLLEEAYSPIYFVYAARMVCKLLGYDTFQMWVLYVISGGFYILLLGALYAMLLPPPPPPKIT